MYRFAQPPLFHFSAHLGSSSMYRVLVMNLPSSLP